MGFRPFGCDRPTVFNFTLHEKNSPPFGRRGAQIQDLGVRLLLGIGKKAYSNVLILNFPSPILSVAK